MRKPLLAAAAGASLALGLGGCVSLLPKSAPAQLYRFGADVSAPAAAVPSGAKVGVVLGQIGFPRASTSDGILAATGDQTAYIAGARWVAPARILFQEAVERAFEAKAVKTQLVNVGEAGPAGAILSIEVSTFEARYAAPGARPVANVAFSARMTASDGRFLGERRFAAAEPTGANSASAIVNAFNRATDGAMTELVGWADTMSANAVPPRAGPAIGATTSTTSSMTSTTTEHR
jgi:cholesterol transport system auxiliary component